MELKPLNKGSKFAPNVALYSTIMELKQGMERLGEYLEKTLYSTIMELKQVSDKFIRQRRNSL